MSTSTTESNVDLQEQKGQSAAELRQEAEDFADWVREFRTTAAKTRHKTRPLAHERLRVAFAAAEENLALALSNLRGNAAGRQTLSRGDLEAVAHAFLLARTPELRELCATAIDREAQPGEFSDAETFPGDPDYDRKLQELQARQRSLEAAAELAAAEEQAAAARQRIAALSRTVTP